MNPKALERRAILAEQHKTPVPAPVVEDNTLTPQQILNWRHVLLGMIGPYALIMPAADVQAMRDNLQKHLNQ